MRQRLALAVSAACLAAATAAAPAAIVTTTGPSYTYAYDVGVAPVGTSGVDPNAAYTGQSPKVTDLGTSRGYQDTGPFGTDSAFTILYEFTTPTGYAFGPSASVFTRGQIYQDPQGGSILGEYSIDGGANYTPFYLLTTRTSRNTTDALAIAGADSVLIRYTYDRNNNVTDMALFISPENGGAGGSPGFVFAADVAAVPEPACLALMSAGAVLASLRSRRS